MLVWGLLVYSKNPNLTLPEIIPFLLNNYCPTGLKGLLGAGVIAMCISTTESLLNCNAVVFTNDVVPIFHKMFSKKTYLPSVFMVRVATIAFCCTSVYVALYIKDLFRIFMVFGNFYYPVVMIPSILLILGCNIKRTSIMCGVLCGILATFLNYILTGSLSSYFLGIIAHLVGLLLTELVVRMRGKNDKASATEQEV